MNTNVASVFNRAYAGVWKIGGRHDAAVISTFKTIEVKKAGEESQSGENQGIDRR